MPLPFVFSNDTVADADQVQADFDYLDAELSARLRNRGAHVATTLYKTHDVVKSGASWWIALVDNTGVTPTEGATWTAFGGGGGSSGHAIKDEGLTLTARTGLNFIGDSVNATDDAAGNETEVAINHLATAVHSVAQPVAIQVSGVPASTAAILDLFAGSNITLTPDASDPTKTKVTIAATTTATVWRNAAGAPSNSLGADGDYYLNNTTGDVYKRTAGAYAVVASIRGTTGATGATGATGPAGATGATWRDGAGVPDNSIGANLDYYLNTANGDVYQRQSGAYVLTGNIRGPQGIQGTAGATGATGAAGTNGTNGTNGQGVPVGGTAGQVLSKIDATDYSTQWVAQSGGGIAATIVDAKGDIIAATAADAVARLAVGSNGQVLTADSVEATGLKWATAAGGGTSGALTHIATTTVGVGGVASVVFSSIPSTYKSLRVIGMVRGNAASGIPAFSMRFNGSATAVYDSQLMFCGGPTPGGAQYNDTPELSIFSIPGAAHLAGCFMPFFMDIPAYASTNHFKGITGMAHLGVPAVAIYLYTFGGLWKSTAALNSITFFCNTGNLAQNSVISLYGVS